MPDSMKYSAMGLAIGQLTEQKNEAYGDSFEKAGKVLELLYPNGIRPDQFKDALGIVRVVDKLFRIATRKDAFGESPWKDIAGYGVLGAVGDADEECEEPSVVWPPKVGDTVSIVGALPVELLAHNPVGVFYELEERCANYPYRLRYTLKGSDFEQVGLFSLSEIAPCAG